MKKYFLIKKTNFIIFIIITVIVILFDLYKAANASFTHDESFSFLHYVHRSFMDIISYKDPTPNNHILNTLLMKLSEALFGASELTFRLPNILAHLLFLIFTFKMIDRVCNKNFIFAFILLNANPYLLDFFSLARGYGLAIGLMSASLYFYCRYLENSKTQNHIFSLVFIGLASLANFALLNVFLILILAHNIFLFFIERKPLSLKSLWQGNNINLIAVVIISFILYEPLRKIFNDILTDFGGQTGFWKDTVESLLSRSAYCAPYEKYIVIVWQLFIITFFLLFVLRCGKYFSDRNSINLTQKFVLLFGLFIFFLIVSSIIQHQLFGTPFLNGRFALFIYPLFILMSIFIFADLWNSSLKYLIRGFLFFISLVFLLHTCYMINASSCYEWAYDSNTKNAVNKIKEIYEKNATYNRKIAVRNTWFYEPTINFYKTIYSMNYLERSTRDIINTNADFIYTVATDTININNFSNFFFVVCKFEDTKSILFKKKNNSKENCIQRIGDFEKKEVNRVTVHLKAANNKYLCANKSLNNFVVANRDKASLWETFTLIQFENNGCAIFAYDNHFLCAEINKQKEITATRANVSTWETFTIIELGDNFVSFKAVNNKYLSFDEKTFQIFAKGDSIGKQEKFELITK